MLGFSIQLVHWNAEEAEERAKVIRDAGYQVNHEIGKNPLMLIRELKKKPPAVIAISLDRLPMQGRDLAIALRLQEAIRYLPIVFVGGDPKKVARVRETIPDAVYTSWDDVNVALNQAISNPPTNPIRPSSVFSVYSNVPLQKKLGIKSNSIVTLINPPPNFGISLGELPPGAKFHRGKLTNNSYNLVLWFVRSRQELEDKISEMAQNTHNGAIWIAWRKKMVPGQGRKEGEVSQEIVRKAGLASGMVDYKICAIDANWSGLLFTRRHKSK
jgi:CheY-like chemotaxis protein